MLNRQSINKVTWIVRKSLNYSYNKYQITFSDIQFLDVNTELAVPTHKFIENYGEIYCDW